MFESRCGGIAGRIRAAGRLNRAHYGETQHYGKMIVGPPGGGPACRVHPQRSPAAISAVRQAITASTTEAATGHARRLDEAVHGLRSRTPRTFRSHRTMGLAATRAGGRPGGIGCRRGVGARNHADRVAGHLWRRRSSASSCCAPWRFGSWRTRCRSLPGYQHSRMCSCRSTRCWCRCSARRA